MRKNILSGGIYRFLGLIVSFLTSIIVARYLGPAGKGILDIWGLVLAVGAFTLGFSLDTANTYFLGKSRYNVSEIHTFSILWTLISGLGLFINFFLFGDIIVERFFPGTPKNLIFLAIISTPFSIYLVLWSGIVIGVNRLVLFFKFTFFSQLGLLVLTIIVLVILECKVNELIIVTLFFMIASTFVAFVILKRQEDFSFIFCRPVFRDSLAYATKFHIGILAYFLHLKIDQFLINFFVGAAGVGWYVLAVSMVERVWLVTTIFRQGGLFQVVAREEVESREITAKLARNVLFVSSLLVILLGIFGRVFIELVYGVEYLPSVTVLYWLLPGILSLAVAPILSTFIAMQLGKPEITALFAAVSLGCNLSLNLYLIPRWGINGAAIATTVSYFINFLLTLIFYVRKTRISLKELFIIGREDLTVYRHVMVKVVKEITVLWRRFSMS